MEKRYDNQYIWGTPSKSWDWLHEWLQDKGFEIHWTGGGFFHYELVIKGSDSELGDCIAFATYGQELPLVVDEDWRLRNAAVHIGFREEDGGFDFDAPSHSVGFENLRHQQFDAIKTAIEDAIKMVNGERVSIRAKWIMEGAPTLDACKEALLDFIDYIEGQQKDGYELEGPITNDSGFMVKKDD